MRIPKTARNISISILVMVLIFIIAAVAYVYLTGGQTTQNKKAEQTVKPATPEILKPVQPSANAPEGVAIESFLTPVKAGENTTLSIRSNAGSTCSIEVTYKNDIKSHDSGLTSRKTDIYGFVTWTWTVEKTVPPGTYPAKVTCVYNGRSGVVIGNLEVTAG